MNLLAAANDIGVLEALELGALGYGVVFLGLILLMLVVILVGKSFSKKKAEAKPAEPVVAAAPVAAPVAVSVEPVACDAAPGSAGRLKIHDVPPKTAAMLMAIVANQMGKPLNELRFISIKEVK